MKLRRLAVALVAATLGASCGVAAPPMRAGAARRQGPSAKEITPPPGLTLETTCVSTGPELCFDAVDNNCNGLLEEGCGVASGVVQIAAAWPDDEADVDLLVVDPSGEQARPGSVTTSGLSKDRDCPGSDRKCRGQNMENVYLEAEAEPARGPYRVTLRLEKTGAASLPIRVHVGARIGPQVYGLVVELNARGEEKTMTFRL